MIHNNISAPRNPRRAAGWNTAAAQPFLILLDLPLKMTRSSSGDDSYYATTTTGQIWLTIVNGEYVAVSRTESTASGKGQKFTIFGDTESDAHWYPLQPLYDQLEAGEMPEEIDLTVVRERMAKLSQKVVLLSSDSSGASASSLTQTVMAFLRVKSEAEGQLALFLSETVEINLDPDFYDVESGSITISPNATLLGPIAASAVPMYDEGDSTRLRLRPAVMTFDDEWAATQPQTVGALSTRLTELGYSREDRLLLNDVLSELRDCMDD